MYVNKCIKCGAEFETKNPKRVICPNCLYADKSSSTTESSLSNDGSQRLQSYSSYSTEDRPQRQYDNRNNYSRPRNNYGNNNRRYDNNRGQGGYNQGGGYQQRRPYDNNRSGGYNQGGYNRQQPNRRPRPQQQRRPMNNRPKRVAKPLLISKEQLEQIEIFYKTMLPLPNPDAHEVIGEKLSIEPRKVFFGINLVRQKLMLPKLPYPKRKLAVTPDQMLAVKSLYEPLLPLPPIGCHKIIAAQLRIDEWRVHVAIKLIRAQMGLDRWNEERPDKPADYLVPKHPQKKAEEKAKKAAAKAEAEAEPVVEEPKVEEKTEETQAEEVVEEKPKKRTTRKTTKKAEKAEEVTTTEEKAKEEPAPEKPKRGRKPKKKEDE